MPTPTIVDFLRARAKVATRRPRTSEDMVALLMHGSAPLAENEARAFARGGYSAYMRTARANRGLAEHEPVS